MNKQVAARNSYPGKLQRSRLVTGSLNCTVCSHYPGTGYSCKQGVFACEMNGTQTTQVPGYPGTRGFADQNLRHTPVHSPMVRKSCLLCHKHHHRCSGDLPCSRCVIMARSRNVAAVELCNYETRQEALRRKVAEFSTMAGSNDFVQQAEGVVEAETQCEEQTQMEPETPVFQQHSASTDGEAERITRVFHGLLFSSSLASAVRKREEQYKAKEDRTVKEYLSLIHI